MEICETSGLPIPTVPRLHHRNGYTKRKLRVWRAQKCIGLVGAETVLTNVGLHITLFHERQYKVGNGNMRNFGPTNPHGTTNAMFISKASYGYGYPKNLLLQSMEKPHLHVQVCKLPRFMGGSVGPRMEICETSGLPIPMLPRFHQSNVYIKRKLRLWRAQKCIALVDEETVFTSAGPQTTSYCIVNILKSSECQARSYINFNSFIVKFLNR